MQSENIGENLERSYNLFIEREEPFPFFKGLAEYLDYVFDIPLLREVVHKQLAERNAHYKKIKEFEKKATQEIESSKHKLLKIIKDSHIDTTTFKRYATMSIPPFEDVVKELDAYEKNIIQKGGYQSDGLKSYLFDIAANLLQAGYKEKIAEFLVSDKEYRAYYDRINGHPLDGFYVGSNEYGNFIFSKTLPARYEAEALLEREREIKPWGSFEKIIQFKHAFETVARNVDFWSFLQSADAKSYDFSLDTKDLLEIGYMVEDLQLLMGGNPIGPSRYRTYANTLEEKISRLHMKAFKPNTQTVHDRLMRTISAYESEPNVRKGNKKVTLPRFPRTEWSHVSIKFIDNQNILISNDKTTKPCSFEGFGCKDNRNDRPDAAWGFLRGLALNNGSTSAISKRERESVKKQKQKITDILRQIFHNQTDPFETGGGGIYKALFSIKHQQNDAEKEDKFSDSSEIFDELTASK